MATYNTYIGARYVPLIMGAYDATKAYEPLTIVLYEGASYTSKQAVPAGVTPTNDEYWALTGNYNAQVEQYRTEVNEYKQQVTDAVQTVEEELEEQTQAFEGKISEYNANATEKTTAFNTNYETKLNTFNTNAQNKTEAFNSNAEEKTNAYNSNATTKYNAYNDNANTRSAELSALVNQARDLVTALGAAVKNVTITSIDHVYTSGIGTTTFIQKNMIQELTGCDLISDIRSNFIMLPSNYDLFEAEEIMNKYARGELTSEQLATIENIYATKESNGSIFINANYSGYTITYPEETQSHLICYLIQAQAKITN